MKVFLFLSWIILAFGCASGTKQTDHFFSTEHNFPPIAQVPSVPFIHQPQNFCGPATLAMAMNWAAQNVNIDEMSSHVWTPGAQGSFQTDMISAARRRGLMAVPIKGLESLLKEISTGHPVIIFENLGISWLPQWHYAVVIGYDLIKKNIILHSGPNPNLHEDMREFERSWMRGDYWGLVVLPPGRLAASANELEHLKAAAALEQLQKLEPAMISYNGILQRWPNSLASRIGIGNIAYARKDYLTAIKNLESATESHPDSAAAWHNLTLAQAAMTQNKLARVSARTAMKLSSPEEKINFASSLRPWLSEKK